MKKNYDHLISKFKQISNKGYIKGINETTNSIGLTFENELGKKADSMFWADYEGIEIKCKSRFSKYPICLFTKAFDGPYLYQTNIILTKYGKKSQRFTNRKQLITDLSCNKFNFYNNYLFKLKVDEKKKKILFQVYNNDYQLIEETAYIDYDSIKNTLLIKLNNLALVRASKKIINHNQYHRYYKISIYKLISFDKFIELLKQDIIKTKIELRISQSGSEKGRQRNKNIVFSIDEQNIELLFIKIKEYNHDTNSNLFK